MAQKSVLSVLGNAVRKARKAAGFTQAKAAERAGVGVAAVRAIERGRGRVHTLAAVLAALRLELRGRGLVAGPIGPALRGARARRRQSRRALATALGLSRNTLAAIEQNGGLVSALEAYAGAVGARLYIGGINDVRAFYVHAGNGSDHHGWETPADLGAALSLAVGRFNLDPCAASHDMRRAKVKARLLLTIEDRADGFAGLPPDCAKPLRLLAAFQQAEPDLGLPAHAFKLRLRLAAQELLAALDGLAAPWHGRVFVNPPYGRALPHWVHKCAAESASGRATVVALLPARPDTRWWHEHVASAADVFMLCGRLRFGDGKQAAPFPSAVVTWGAEEELLARLASMLPGAWHVPRRP